MRTVLVYRSGLLPVSEVWIKEQLQALKNWQAILVGRGLIAEGLDLSGLQTVLVDPGNGRVARWTRALRNLVHLPRRRDVQNLKARNAGLIHIHFGVEAVQVWPLARAVGVPVLVTLHGYDINTLKSWWQEGHGGRSNRNYPSRLVEIARAEDVHFIAVSEAIKRRAIDYGISEDKVTVSHLGVDTQRFCPGETPLSDRVDVLFVGRLVEKKGCQYLLEAFQRVQDEYPRSELVVIGEGELESQLKDYARANGLRVRFMGAQTHEQVMEHLGRARMFCLPSIVAENGDAEGLPVSILEAQACGVPVLTSAQGGIEEGIKDGITGIALKERDVGGLADGLSRLLGNDELLESMGRAARDYMVEAMDLRACTARLEGIYDHLLSTQQHA